LLKRSDIGYKKPLGCQYKRVLGRRYK